MGEEVIFAASSCSLACLENMVHKSGRGSALTYRTMVIYIPDNLATEQLNLQDLPEQWNQTSLCSECRQLVSNWYQA